jgi:hypothetical protein
MLRHEIDGISCDMVGSQDKVTLVFTIFFIDQNHHSPSTELGNDFFGRGEFIWHSPLF